MAIGPKKAEDSPSYLFPGIGKSAAIDSAVKSSVVMQLRIAVFGMNRLLRELFARLLTSDRNIHVLTFDHEEANMAEIVSSYRPQLLITCSSISANRKGEDEFAALFEIHPPLKLLSVSENERAGFLYRLGPQRIRIGELSLESLDAAFREPWLGPVTPGGVIHSNSSTERPDRDA